MSVFNLYAAQIGSVLYDGIFNQTVDPGVERTLLGSDGIPDPTHAAVLTANPRVGFSSYRIDQFLDLNTKTFATVGMYITGSNGLNLWFQKLKHGGVRETSGHKKIAISEGLLYPKTLSAQQGAPAKIDVEMIACRTDSSEPFVVSTSALSGTPALSQPFTVGPVKLDGDTLEYVQAVNIDFGLSIVTLANEGFAAPEFVAIQTRQPSITVEFSNAGMLEELGEYGCAVTSLSVGFRACTHGGIPEALAEESHVILEATSGHVSFDSMSFSHGNHVVPTMSFALTKGSESILTVSTSAALTSGL